MRIATVLACLALLVLAGAKSFAADTPVDLTPPAWLAEQPSFEDLARAYPEDALKKGLNGHTVITCTVKPDGYLQDCAVTSETPPGEGFGQASLALAAKFRVKPGSVKADASGATRISIPIRWAMFDNPDWIRRPNGDAFVRYFPSKALNAGISGRAVMTCRVEVDGSLSHCFITSETPLGFGFGEATLKLAQHFKMKAQTIDGRPVEGALVIIPIHWSVMGGPDTSAGGIGGFLVTVAHGDEKKGAQIIDCATKDNPKRRCVAHRLIWEESPAADLVAQALNENHGLKGSTHVWCTVRGDGALIGCVSNQPTTDAQKGAVLMLASHLKTSDRTRDGVPVIGAQVIVVFNWDELRFEAEEAHQKLH
jgi:TonB family protein